VSSLFSITEKLVTWTKKTDMQTGRFWLSASAMNNRIYASAMNNRIYAIGGTQDMIINLSTVEEYNPGTSESINFKGKLPTTWGDVRTVINK
jgi:hypothetical protein